MHLNCKSDTWLNLQQYFEDYSSWPVVFRDRLSASDMLQVRKVMEHVYEKIINLDTESQTTSSSANEKPGEQEKEEDMAVMAEEKIELMCLDQVRPAITFLLPPDKKTHSMLQYTHYLLFNILFSSDAETNLNEVTVI